MGWIETDSGDYAVSLEDGQVVCRNAAGRRLKRVPPKLGDDSAVVRLRQLTEWLERHARECREQVDTWLVRSLPVPAALLARVWEDESWRAALRDLVIAPVGADGKPEMDRAGFLRDADPVKGIGVVDLDGDSVRLECESVLIPHPVLLDDLDDLREFAVELEVEQGVEQLFREVWRRPAEVSGGAWKEYEGGVFRQLRQVTSRAVALGYRVRGGQAICPLVEDGVPVDAMFWLGADYPDAEARTGSLEWWDRGGKGRPLTAVGPVAWSEGVRMAALLYAGRLVEDEQEDMR
jgi:hypothetical protein